jgi:hypothetical protein
VNRRLRHSFRNRVRHAGLRQYGPDDFRHAPPNWRPLRGLRPEPTDLDRQFGRAPSFLRRPIVLRGAETPVVRLLHPARNRRQRLVSIVGAGEAAPGSASLELKKNVPGALADRRPAVRVLHRGLASRHAAGDRRSSGTVPNEILSGAFPSPLLIHPNSSWPARPSTSPGVKRVGASRRSRLPVPRRLDPLRARLRRRERILQDLRFSRRQSAAVRQPVRRAAQRALRRTERMSAEIGTASVQTAEVLEPPERPIRVAGLRRGRRVLCRIRDQTGLRQVAPRGRPDYRYSRGSWNCSYWEASRFPIHLQEEHAAFGAGLLTPPRWPTAGLLALRETLGQVPWLGPPLFAAVPETGHNIRDYRADPTATVFSSRSVR